MDVVVVVDVCACACVRAWTCAFHSPGTFECPNRSLSPKATGIYIVLQLSEVQNVTSECISLYGQRLMGFQAHRLTLTLALYLVSALYLVTGL